MKNKSKVPAVKRAFVAGKPTDTFYVTRGASCEGVLRFLDRIVSGQIVHGFPIRIRDVSGGSDNTVADQTELQDFRTGWASECTENNG